MHYSGRMGVEINEMPDKIRSDKVQAFLKCDH